MFRKRKTYSSVNPLNSQQANSLNSQVESAINAEYQQRNISHELYQYDQQILMRGLVWLTGFVSSLESKNWPSISIETKTALVREALYGFAKATALNLQDVRFGKFRNPTIHGIANHTPSTPLSPPTSKIVISIDHLGKNSLKDILITCMHECGHVYQAKLLWKLICEAPSRLPKDVEDLRQESIKNFDDKKRQYKSPYASSLIERHANAFGYGLVAGLTLIAPQAFTMRPQNKDSNSFTA